MFYMGDATRKLPTEQVSKENQKFWRFLSRRIFKACLWVLNSLSRVIYSYKWIIYLFPFGIKTTDWQVFLSLQLFKSEIQGYLCNPGIECHLNTLTVPVQREHCIIICCYYHLLFSKVCIFTRTKYFVVNITFSNHNFISTNSIQFINL